MGLQPLLLILSDHASPTHTQVKIFESGGWEAGTLVAGDCAQWVASCHRSHRLRLPPDMGLAWPQRTPRLDAHQSSRQRPSAVGHGPAVPSDGASTSSCAQPSGSVAGGSDGTWLVVACQLPQALGGLGLGVLGGGAPVSHGCLSEEQP